MALKNCNDMRVTAFLDIPGQDNLPPLARLQKYAFSAVTSSTGKLCPASAWLGGHRRHVSVTASQYAHLHVCACSLHAVIPQGVNVHTVSALGPLTFPPLFQAGWQGPPHLVIEALQEIRLLHQGLHIGLQV